MTLNNEKATVYKTLIIAIQVSLAMLFIAVTEHCLYWSTSRTCDSRRSQPCSEQVVHIDVVV